MPAGSRGSPRPVSTPPRTRRAPAAPQPTVRLTSPSAATLPRPACGDAHALVVVAGRTARGERVTEPEAVLSRDAVGDVGERRRALVRRDDEIRVVVIVANDACRRHDRAVDDVVGEIEQS